MAEKCTDSSDDGANVDGLRITEIRESGDQIMVGAEFDSTFGTKSWREDTALVVEERRIYVSRGVLSLLSPVFTQMFEEKIKDSGSMEIELERKTLGNMIEFLKCIYPNIMKEVTLENMFVVLPLAVEFGIDQLKKRCEHVLLENTDDTTKSQNICMYLSKAFEFSMTRLQNKCIEIASHKSFTDFKEAEKEFPLPVEAKLEIQGKMIEKMETRIEAVKLNEILVGSIDVSKLKNPHVGYLEYTWISSGNTIHMGPPSTVHGITWCIEVDPTKPEAFGLYLQAKQSDGHPKWNCQARATLRLCNYKDDEASISKTYDHVYSESGVNWGYPKFAEMSNVKDPNEGFIKDSKVRVDICFLVEEPTYK